MEQSGLTVAIPVYNDAEGVERAFRLIEPNLGQVRELLILDDGSTDDTPGVLEVLARDRSTVRVLHNERNRGVNFSVNRLAREAAGNGILYVSANDEISEELIPWAVEKAEQYPDVGIIFSDFILDNGKKRRVVKPDPDWSEERVWDPSGFRDDYLAKARPTMSASAVYHRESMLELGGYLEECGAYSDLFLMNLLGASKGAVYTPVTTVRFIVNQDSFVRRSTRGPFRALAFLRNVFRWMNRSPFREVLGKSYPRIFLFERSSGLLIRDLQPFFTALRARWPRRSLKKLRAIVRVMVRLVSGPFSFYCIVEAWLIPPKPYLLPEQDS